MCVLYVVCHLSCRGAGVCIACSSLFCGFIRAAQAGCRGSGIHRVARAGVYVACYTSCRGAGYEIDLCALPVYLFVCGAFLVAQADSGGLGAPSFASAGVCCVIFWCFLCLVFAF